MALISTHLTLFLEFLSTDHKKMVKIENLVNNQEKWAKIPNFVIFEPFQHAIPQKKHFSHRIQIQAKKYDFFQEKLKKI